MGEDNLRTIAAGYFALTPQVSIPVTMHLSAGLFITRWNRTHQENRVKLLITTIAYLSILKIHLYYAVLCYVL